MVCLDSFVFFLALPRVPYILLVGGIAELSLALWLLGVGVNEAKWRAHAHPLENGHPARR